jgi:CheY-like chemotaxis protein
VDDNQTNRTILVQNLRRWSAHAHEAVDGPSALGALQRAAASGAAFDLVLSDFHMPEMDGLSLAETIRADPSIQLTPIILLSSAILKDHRERLDRCNLHATLQKPVRQSSLLRAMQSLWAPPEEAEAQAVSDADESPKPVTPPALILVAEDNLINQKLALRLLQKLGHRATVVANGQEAIDALAGTPFDLVLIDCQMPVMDGYQATRRIREMEAISGRHLPVIALTANVLTEEREHCRAAGMDDYLSKPVRLAELAAKIDQWSPPATRLLAAARHTIQAS